VATLKETKQKNLDDLNDILLIQI